MTLLILKLTAMITMLIDHTGLKFMGDMSAMRFIGRTAFVLYAFMAADALLYTQKKGRVPKYMARLLVLALVSEIPYDLCMSGTCYNPEKNNVIFTLFGGCAAALIMEYSLLTPLHTIRRSLKDAGAAAVIRMSAGAVISPVSIYAICLAVKHFGTSYHYVGVMLVLSFYLVQRYTRQETAGSGAGKKQALRLLLLFAVITLYVLYYTVFTYRSRENAAAFIVRAFKRRTWIQLGSYFALPLIFFYKGKKGYADSRGHDLSGKAFDCIYRLFYPAHLLILWLLLLI